MANTKTHLYLQIAEAIRRQILSGEIKPGDRLPSVRSLSKEWHCTPGTVSRAYANLAEQGIVIGQRGGGTRVSTNPILSKHPSLGWAALVNRSERLLLEAIHAGYTPLEAQTALSIAISRWETLQPTASPIPTDRSTPEKTCLHFVGSHDLMIVLIERLVKGNASTLELSIDFAGSLGGLIALAQNEADLAGVHLWDESSGIYNVPFVQRILPGRRVALLTLAHRQLGLILPPGNPQNITRLEDLAKSSTFFVNRQRGSGTRVWLDAKLRKRNISTNSINGFHNEKNTHLGVAQMVADGSANLGLGIYAAASSYGLDFIPLTTERYDLVIPEHSWELSAMQDLIKIIQSEQFRDSVAALGGYELTETSHETWLGSA